MTVCSDNKDMDYDCVYNSENMIYRRIKKKESYCT